MELILDKNKKREHLYLEVFHYYRELIMEKKLPPGSRMPSLRKCSQELKLSRTTIENAYLQLAAEGYIISKALFARMKDYCLMESLRVRLT